MSELGKAARPATINTGDHAPESEIGMGEDDDFADVVPFSLEAATRLVDPMRLNNLTPAEITPRYLRKARREVRQARRGLVGIQHTSFQLLRKARVEAQRGQQLARMQPGQRRAKQMQSAIRRITDLREHFAALHDERSRFARKIAAARELETGWEAAPGKKRFTGQLAAQGLKQVALVVAREERVARDWLDELERELQHVTVAEDAMRRDSGVLRMDPVTFARFAGRRSRIGVRLSILAVIIAMLALLYPPWAPPRLALGCSFPTQDGACNQIHATSDLRITNTGYGALVGWISIVSQRNGANATRVQPLFVLPQSTSALSCGDLGNCTASAGGAEEVTITSTGGSYTITFVP